MRKGCRVVEVVGLAVKEGVRPKEGVAAGHEDVVFVNAHWPV